MSTTSTPARTRPALVIPGLDNRNPFDGKASMISCHGLPTPPQSALDSRRPSLQFSTVPEYAPSAGSLMGTLSQPSTPIRTVSSHGDDFSHSWSEHGTTTTNTPSNLVHSLSATHLGHSLLQPAFRHQQAYQSCDIDYLASLPEEPSHATDVFGPCIDTPASSTWNASHHVSQPLAAEASSGLGPPLFAMSGALGKESNSLYQSVQHPPHYHQQQLQSSQSYRAYSSTQDSFYQPQVVVPSQLLPHDDFSQHQYHALTSPDHATASFSHSFSTETGSFELVTSSTSESRYFLESDEEDYVHVHDRAADPTYRGSLRRSTASRSRRRVARRTRNTATNYSHVHQIGNTEVIIENFDPANGLPVGKGSAPKRFRCTHLNEDGSECGSMFERGEHLKRHAGKHSTIRHYPCPLPDCDKEIQRPDNAADHFKTHLKPTKKGKRNKHFEWAYVRRAIRTAYSDEKRAGKLLVNLQKWIDAGMPESASQRRGAQGY